MTINLVTRKQWGSKTTNNVRLDGALPEVYVHHVGGGHSPTGLTAEKQHMRSLQTYAISTKKYTDLDYNFIVGNSTGSTFEGRGLGFKSAATLDRNDVSRSVCVMGNFETEVPTPDAIQATIDAIVYMVVEEDLSRDVIVRGHRDNPEHVNATRCPGTYLYANIDNIAEGVRRGIEAAFPPPIPPIIYPAPCTLRVDGFTAVFLYHNDLTMTWVQADEAEWVYTYFGQPNIVDSWEHLSAHGTIVGKNPGQV